MNILIRQLILHIPKTNEWNWFCRHLVGPNDFWSLIDVAPCDSSTFIKYIVINSQKSQRRKLDHFSENWEVSQFWNWDLYFDHWSRTTPSITSDAHNRTIFVKAIKRNFLVIISGCCIRHLIVNHERLYSSIMFGYTHVSGYDVDRVVDTYRATHHIGTGGAILESSNCWNGAESTDQE